MATVGVKGFKHTDAYIDHNVLRKGLRRVNQCKWLIRSPRVWLRCDPRLSLPALCNA